MFAFNIANMSSDIMLNNQLLYSGSIYHLNFDIEPLPTIVITNSKRGKKEQKKGKNN